MQKSNGRKTKRNVKAAQPRRCTLCGKPGQRANFGVGYTTIAPHLGICVDCINGK